MNKELIKKYKTEFDYWLNGGNLVSKHPDEQGWYIVTTALWNNPNMQYIINDEYVELRIALAEGKQIQFKNAEEWKDITFLTIRPEETPDMYRIKPELTIKVGDWLFDIKDHEYSKIVAVYTETVKLQSGHSVFLTAIEDGYFKIWKPEVTEWCIVDKPNTSDRDYSFTIQKWQSDSTWTPAPYTGPLPYFIKE